MSGFVCLRAEDINFGEIEVDFFSLTPVVSRRKLFGDFCVYGFSRAKFLNDQVWGEDDEVVVILTGAILNFSALRLDYEAGDYFQTVKKMYQAEGDDFFNSFRGVFSGMLYDKAKNKWLAFTDHTGAKPLFYYHQENIFICATEVQTVTQILKRLGRKFSLDETGGYMLLTFAYMLEDYTLVKEIKRLRPGGYIRYEQNKAEIYTYHEFTNAEVVGRGREEIIENLEGLFRQAVAREYDKDRQYDYRHLATLSGGLDSRMSVFTAHEMGYDGIVLLTFSQSNYWDQIIAQEIAADLGLQISLYNLDNGNHLLNTIEDTVGINGGLVLYSGAAHALTMYRLFNFNSFGILHTGQIGDAVMGSFLKQPRQLEPKTVSGIYSSRLIDRIAPTVERIISNYETEEMFLFYSRCFNGAVNGYWVAQQYTEATSPFLDVDFLDYALAISPVLKCRQKLYRDWILARRPAAARYIWEKTRAKISAPDSLVKARRYVRLLRERILGQRACDSMNPFEHWYRTNPHLSVYLDQYFSQNIDVLNSYPELHADCQALYQKSGVEVKCMCLTLLQAVKLHFGGR